MPFPPHIDHVLTAYGIRAETKAALYDLYLAMGGEVLEVFADLADGVTAATMLEPDDTLTIREQVVERYLRRNHPRWLEGMPTAESVASARRRGTCGRGGGAAGGVAGERAARGRGRSAVARRHSRPGAQRAFRWARGDDLVRRRGARSRTTRWPSARPRGSSTRFPARSAPRPERSTARTAWRCCGKCSLTSISRPGSATAPSPRSIAATATGTSLRWPRRWNGSSARTRPRSSCRGAALAITHEVNPAKPVSEAIAAMHDRTVESVALALGMTLTEPAGTDDLLLLDSERDESRAAPACVARGLGWTHPANAV